MWTDEDELCLSIAMALSCSLPRMYYLYAPQLDIADAAARREGWRPRVGREWLRPDGERVKFISLTEQLAIIEPGMTVYVVGLMPRELRRMKGVTVIKIL